jgi:hypothetical protein
MIFSDFDICRLIFYKFMRVIKSLHNYSKKHLNECKRHTSYCFNLHPE